MFYADLKNDFGLPMVVASAVYEDGRRQMDIPVERAGQYEARPGRFVWIGLHEPSEELLGTVQAQFNLHPLAVEDAHRPHMRPKLDIYGDAVFMVLRTVQLRTGQIIYGETHVFAGPGYVVSVRHGPSLSYGEVRQRCEREQKLLRHGEDYVLYAIMDFVADNFFPVLDEISDEVSALEEQVQTQSFKRHDIARLYQLRRELLGFRRTVLPMLEVCSRLERFDLPMIDNEIRPYYRDVHDHVRIVAESVDNLRDALAAAFEAALMLQSAAQNDVIRKLAAWAAILAVPTAVAGVYGMNFEHMPELRWTYGYAAVMAFIGLVCATLFFRFRKAGWL